MKPIIGVTADLHRGSRIPARLPDENVLFMWDYYLSALFEAGALPVLLPFTDARGAIRSMVDRFDGFLLAPGNFDLPPELFGEERKPWLGPVKLEVSRFECELVRIAAKKDVPMLGICGGMQTINVAFGGTLYQDIATERPQSRSHSQKTRQDLPHHQVTVSRGTRLSRILSARRGKDPVRIRVNSTHHQAIRDLAPSLKANCFSADGIIEGIESDAHRFLLGVQWHPELLYKKTAHQAAIFRTFARAASKKS